jgi:hypothetical protein
VGTLFERQTRVLLLLHLPDNHGAEAVEEAMRDGHWCKQKRIYGFRAMRVPICAKHAK